MTEQDLRIQIVVYLSFYVEARDNQDAKEMGRWIDKIEQLIQQEANRQVIKELEWAKTASVWNIDARVKELKEQL